MDADAAEPRGPLSFSDRVCFMVARRDGFTCVTNDGNLRKRCRRDNVPVFRSLKLLSELHSQGGISTEDVLEVATRIHEINSRYITSEILERFKTLIRDGK